MISGKIMGITLMLLMLLLGGTQAFDQFYPFEVATGELVTPMENSGAPWFKDSALMYFGTGKDASLSYNAAMDKLYINDTPVYLEEAVTFGSFPLSTYLDTEAGLKVGSSKAQVNLSPDMGLAYDTGARLGAIKIVNGHGIDLGASGVEVDPDDIRDPLTGLVETTSNHLGINLSASSGLMFGTGATEGALKIDPADASLALAAGGVSVKTGALKHLLADGTASGANVVVVGMAVGDELISVISYATKASIATMNDRSLEYAVGSGVLTKAAGTNETGNQLDIWYWDRTA